MIKKLFIILISIGLLVGCTSKKETINIDLPEKVKAMWFSYVDFNAEFKNIADDDVESKVEEIINNCDEIGINTIFVHAVAFTDAMYETKIYPRSSHSDSIDYLKIFVEKAHEKGMHIEAWINPMRSYTSEQMKDISDEYLIKQWVNENNSAIRLFENRYYLNPSVQEAQKLILDVVDELCTNYDIDGIHMDDYFYPAKVTEDFDYEQFIQSGEIDSSTFRKNSVNQLVTKIHELVNSKNKIFGISPSGNIEYSRDVIFGDVDAWVQEGSIDYLVPQIYWGYTNKTKPYLETLEAWQELAGKNNVDLIVGLAGYKIGVASNDSDQEEWNSDESILKKQAVDAIDRNTRGIAIFSYHSLFTQCNELTEINKENLKISTK